MGKLSRDDVLKLAQLSRLTLTDEEVEAYAEEFTEILRYVDHLQSVEVDDLEPTSQVTGLTNVMRDDVVIEYGYTADDLLRGVPNVEKHQIKVKRMVG